MRHGSHLDPPNRFEPVHQERDLEQLAWDDEPLRAPRRQIEYHDDVSQSIVSQNDSPDIPFRYSVNPYRGCAHACAYCYARPTHEYLGLNAGLDFETRIMVKRGAPRLLREFLARPEWDASQVVFSGVTDCYQPAERTYRLTRGCLEVAEACGQPVGIITKNALVLRDLDLLQALAKRQLVHVFLSLTTLKAELAREMEPRTSVPAARLRAVQELAKAGVPVGVMLAPIVPGITDTEIPALLKAAAEAGAMTAHSILLRLPSTVEPVFREWLERTHPQQAEKTLGRLRSMREGKLYRADFSTRQTGTGSWAQAISQTFMLFRKRYGLDRELSPLSSEHFHPPRSKSGQQWLF